MKRNPIRTPISLGDSPTRRSFLKTGGAALGGLPLGGLSLLTGGSPARPLEAAETPARRPADRAKSVILFNLLGGPSQLDMFDMKPADIVATIYQQLGFDPHTTVPDRTGRPMPIAHGGQPIPGLT